MTLGGAWSLFHYLEGFRGGGLSRHDTRDRDEAELHNIEHSHFHNLPAELLWIIHEFLKPEDSFALSLTCARFYYSGILEGVQRDLRSTKLGHFITLCMFEGVGELKEFCCRGCLTTHPASDFSMDELEKRHAERYCLRTKKVFKFTDREYSFADIKRIRDGTQSESSNTPTPQGNAFTKLFSSPEMTIVSKVQLFPYNKPVSKAQFEDLCKKLNYAVCNHMMLGDKCITDMFFPECFLKETGSSLEELQKSRPDKQFHKCKECNTTVAITVGLCPRACCYENCSAIVMRRVGRLLSPLEPEWIAQATSSAGTPADHKLTIEANKWYKRHWVTDGGHGAEIDCPPLNNDALFAPITLHRSSWMARLGVKAWSFACSWVPEDIHRKYGEKNGEKHEMNFAGRYRRINKALGFPKAD
ncbi:hypothetical protein MferCBS31731_005346 [Microsporum ferrugineum]